MIRFKVLNASWTADGEVFPAGDNEVAAPTDALVRLAHHAHAAGALEIEGDVDAAAYGVQSQEEGEAAYAAAQGEWIPPVYAEGGGIVEGTGRGSGGWHDGNVEQYEIEQRLRAAAAEEAANDGDDDEEVAA